MNTCQLYADSLPQGTDAKCPTCGMTDVKFARIIQRTAFCATVAWNIGTTSAIIVGVLFVWWTLARQRSYFYLCIGVWLLCKTLTNRRANFVVACIRDTITKDVQKPCAVAQCAVNDALEAIVNSVEARVAQIRKERV